MDEGVFINWLNINKGFTKRVTRDVASRLKRASLYTDLTLKISKEEMIFKLNSNQEFQKLSTTVKSQMRRAVKLFYEFKNSQ